MAVISVLVTCNKKVLEYLLLKQQGMILFFAIHNLGLEQNVSLLMRFLIFQYGRNFLAHYVLMKWRLRPSAFNLQQHSVCAVADSGCQSWRCRQLPSLVSLQVRHVHTDWPAINLHRAFSASMNVVFMHDSPRLIYWTTEVNIVITLKYYLR